MEVQIREFRQFAVERVAAARRQMVCDRDVIRHVMHSTPFFTLQFDVGGVLIEAK